MANLLGPRAATNNMTPAQQAQAAASAAAQQAQARRAQNYSYLKRALRKFAVCPPASGAGTNQNYSAGATLTYDVPTAQGAFLDSLLVIANLTVTNATGTSAVYALTKGAPLTLFDNIEVVYGGTQWKVRPFILRYLQLLSGYDQAQISQVPSSFNAVTANNTAIWGSFGVATGANTWNFYFRVPLRLLPNSVAGMLPIMGDSTRCQVKVVCAPTAFGNDPILNSEYAVSGSGHSVTVTGTVAVHSIYMDGTNLLSPVPLALDLTGEPTLQAFIDRQLTPLSANLTLRQRVDTKLQHVFMLSVIVDAVQQTDFATNGNINGIELDEDNAGQNKLFAYGTGSANLLYNEFQYLLRDTIGQDLDQGVIPWVAAPVFGVANPSNQDGEQVLNMMPGGWTDINIGVNLASIGALAGVTARVETYCFSLNPAGLVRA